MDGKRTLLLTHPELAADARTALAADRWFGPYFHVDSAQVVQARWDFAQLVDWYDYLMQESSAWWTAGIVSGDKDEQINRIRFGIQTEARLQEVARKLSALHLPCDLIRLDIQAPVQVL